LIAAVDPAGAKTCEATMTAQLRMAIVDADPIFRIGVNYFLRHDAVVEIVGEGDAAPDAIHFAEEQRPDLVLLDIDIPGAIEAVRVISDSYPTVKTIMLGGSSSEALVRSAFNAGARACVRKGIPAQEFVPVMQQVYRGEIYLTPSLLANWLSPINRQQCQIVSDDDIHGLTSRERQILDQVACGHTNKEIAKLFEISEKTVKFHMTTIMEKLHVRNRVEAVLCRLKSGD
jgi:two-component system, NarL family, nitrate/nitrite response regulator NarL